jgi:hypothetical protein
LFQEYLVVVTDVNVVFCQIQIWTEKDGEDGLREIDVKGEKTNTMVTKFIPHSKNFARVLVYNSRYNGPPSETLSFDTPEGGKDLDVFVSVPRTSDIQLISSYFLGVVNYMIHCEIQLIVFG